MLVTVDLLCVECRFLKIVRESLVCFCSSSIVYIFNILLFLLFACPRSVLFAGVGKVACVCVSVLFCIYFMHNTQRSIKMRECGCVHLSICSRIFPSTTSKVCGLCFCFECVDLFECGCFSWGCGDKAV